MKSVTVDLVEDYLRSMNFQIRDRRPDVVIAEQSAVGLDKSTVVTWVVPPPVQRRDRRGLESHLAQEFARTTLEFPRARYFLLSDSTEGLSADFRSTAYKLGVKFRVPIQFFDTPFKAEEVPESATALRSLREAALPANARVAQPFIEMPSKTDTTGEDLLPILLERVESARKAPTYTPHLHLVLGAAGAGKSILFRSLFARLYDAFQDAKSRQVLFPRPIPFTPEHLRGAGAMRTKALVQTLLETDVAVPIPTETLYWLLVHGFGLWMFDGVDELYSGDPGFFDELLELLTRPGSQAQIIMFARESLLTTSDALADLLHDFSPGVDLSLSVYKLAPWERPSKRQFAWGQLEGRRPHRPDENSEAVRGFLDWVGRPGPAKELSGLPFYCDLLLARYRQGGAQDVSDEFELVDSALRDLVHREMAKGLISLDLFERPNGLDEWLETVAVLAHTSQDQTLSRDDLAEYGELVLRESLPEEHRKNAITSLVQFPVFAPGLRPGSVTFNHELLADFLVGRHFAGRLTKEPEWVAEKLTSRIDPANSLVLRVIAKRLREVSGAKDAAAAALRSERLTSSGFKNLLQILVLGSASGRVLKDERIVLEARDLSNVLFERLDLSGMSLRSCDLSGTCFRGCDLRRSKFEGAIISGTRFEESAEGSLAGATFGALERADLVIAGRQGLDEREAIARWVQKVTGLDQARESACPTALQLRALFQKYVHQDGQGRRDELTMSALTRGRRHASAPSPERCIEASQRFEYLGPESQRRFIRRASGERYNEMVRFVSRWEVSTGIRQLLGSLCPVASCQHVPHGFARRS